MLVGRGNGQAEHASALTRTGLALPQVRPAKGTGNEPAFTVLVSGRDDAAIDAGVVAILDHLYEQGYCTEEGPEPHLDFKHDAQPYGWGVRVIVYDNDGQAKDQTLWFDIQSVDDPSYKQS